MAKITINEALNWKKTLAQRHQELVSLRNENSHEDRRYFGANAEKFVDAKPLYDVKQLDKMITTVAKEMRLLDNALKATNASTSVLGYEQDDAVLGELA